MNERTPTRRLMKNVVRSLSGASFTIAGSIVVIYTLSGYTRKVAIAATLVAIIGHVIHSTIELNEGQRASGPSDLSTIRVASPRVAANEPPTTP